MDKKTKNAKRCGKRYIGKSNPQQQVKTGFVASQKAAYFFHTRALPALATQLVCQNCIVLGLAFQLGLAKFGIKGRRISGKNRPHSFLALLFVFGRVKADETSAVGPTIYFDGEALTVKF